MEASYLLHGRMVPEWHLPDIAEAAFQFCGQIELDLLASLHTSLCHCYYTMENTLPLGALGLNALKHPCRYQVNYVFFPSVSVPIILPIIWQNMSQVSSGS